MHKFYVAANDIVNGHIVVKGAEYKHLARVLRIKEGENVLVADNTGTDYFCVLEKLKADLAILKIIDVQISENEPKIDAALYQALPKSDKMEFIIQKCVELGINEIYPVTTKRTIVKIDKKKEGSKIIRWNKIAREAAKQSERAHIPLVNDVIGFKEAIDKAALDSFCIFPYEKQRGTQIKDLELLDKKVFSIFIGPEGGFDPSEVEYAVSKGIIPISLGNRILRTETASLAVLSILMHIKGEI